MYCESYCLELQDYDLVSRKQIRDKLTPDSQMTFLGDFTNNAGLMDDQKV